MLLLHGPSDPHFKNVMATKNFFETSFGETSDTIKNAVI